MPFSVSDYDGGNVYWVVAGTKHPYHGMREAWVFNRAMTWLGPDTGVDDGIICYSARSPLLLTGRSGASRWFCGRDAELSEVDDEFTRLAYKGTKPGWDHVSLPPFQFHVEQTPTAELEIARATCAWRLLAVVKGRSGPPLYASRWHDGPGKLRVGLLKAYRRKGYRKHFAELHFALATRERTDDAAIVFRLRLTGREAIIPSLPVIRTADRAKREGIPIHAIVLDAEARRLGRQAASVAATVGGRTLELAEGRDGVWKGVVRGLPVGQHAAILRAVLKGARARKLESTLAIHVTDGRFLRYDEKLRLLTLEGKPRGPLTGSYRGAPMFQGIGTAAESLVQGRKQWDRVKGDRHEGQYFNHGGPGYGFHFWESLTERELDADYAYLARCGWTVLHLCQGWWVWERLDAGGRIAPHGAEQLAIALAAARRHGLRLHLALSHYPLGKQSKPYARYLQAGYRREDYRRPSSKFYRMFTSYLADFATLFRDETAISSFTASGEGDVDCGKTFVNAVHDFMRRHDRDHLFLCEPHLNPRPYPSDPNYYRRDGWKPLLGGMRTYMIDRQEPEHVGVQFKLGAMGHIFLGEGVFWGFLDAPRQIDRYRRRVRQEFYTGLAYRSPIQLSWEERVVEDERIVFEQVRRLVDWSRPFRRPRLILRIGTDLNVLRRYEAVLSKIPLEYAFILKGDPVPAGALFTLDTQQPFVEPAFRSGGGRLPDALKAHMPLRLPDGWAANYSRTEDGRGLLAYLRHTGGAGGGDVVLQNFPAVKLPFRLFDLDAKRILLRGEFAKRHALKIPKGKRDLFLLVGGGTGPAR